MKPERGKTVVGFVGLGVMGHSMAGHIMRGGYELLVYNRSKEKALDLLTQGAVWKDDVHSLAEKSDVIITMVGFPADVEEVYLGEKGLLAGARPGTVLIDMTTSSPGLAARIAAAGAEKGVPVLDAPVSGGDRGAREGTLSIMVGGDEAVFNDMMPLFSLLGKNIVFQGGPGSGQHTKMANQIAIASNMMGVCEALAYSKKAGLDPEKVLSSISGGAAGSWSLSNLAPRILAGDFAPGFFVKHFIKDMKIALEEAERMGLDAAGLKKAFEQYGKVAARGLENEGTQALYKLYVE
ncbi:NAD(P)-dependent oxidoreductase [Aminivibrio sp.]|uniref:NAD(P)-dependent oxidoreductase n=1 Tax=Aminivibrio sp. TaxID=1872489 RepID=UPI001A51D921|nr:NAD(P)-dependent oxidoreductase [Aminivibrio sp.]MBL3538409.1 NAD(P)-dependent oxidoreductase [Aminivibrio sp.]MDK2958934.1 3-hydroxyisobutyrate dehydrogenase [Synergistaceae bacterium]